jgi:hypothetical protein
VNKVGAQRRSDCNGALELDINQDDARFILRIVSLAVELLLAGVSTEEVLVLLGHSNVGITQKHYSPWVHARQRQLESNLERAWSRDPIVLLNKKSETKLRGLENGLPN